MAGMEGIAAAGKVGRGILAGKGGSVIFGADSKVGRGVFGRFKDGIVGNGGNVAVGMLGMVGSEG